jgi:cell pole-organizing protein PopZ
VATATKTREVVEALTLMARAREAKEEKEKAAKRSDVLKLEEAFEPAPKSEPAPKPEPTPKLEPDLKPEPADAVDPLERLFQVTEPKPPVAYTPSLRDEGLMSPAATEAASAAFGKLTQSLAEHGQTLDDLAREMIKPMLKAWLDDNLPSLVERLVKAEIERVSRSGR